MKALTGITVLSFAVFCPYHRSAFEIYGLRMA
jgi:hypothetical protein